MKLYSRTHVATVGVKGLMWDASVHCLPMSVNRITVTAWRWNTLQRKTSIS